MQSMQMKHMLRFAVWGAALATLWWMGHDAAFAQEHAAFVEEEAPRHANFWSELIANIFNSRGLMRVLSRPEYAVWAFIALNLIVFVETGLLIGFFLPGDSLLVVTGFACASPHCEWYYLPALLVSLSVSAIVGDTVGYWIGYTTGPKIFNREKSLFFDKDHLLKAQEFYIRHGGKTIILARFVPFLRTFAPVVAGVGKMEYRHFLFYNVFGGVLWVFSMILAGRFLPELVNPLLQHPSLFGPGFDVTDHIEKVVIIVVFLSITPGIYAWLKSKLAGKSGSPSAAGTQEKKDEPALATN